MVRPLSNDLRERAVKAVESGESCHAVEARFDVAVSSDVKWRQRYRATGSVAPGKMGGHRKPILEPHRAFIVERIRQTPHLTLHGLKDELAARGVKVSHHAVWTFLRREGLSLKKTLFALEQGRADVARRRQRWRSLQDRLDPNRSSTRPGSRPTWPRCGAGDPGASGCAPLRRTVTGEPCSSSVPYAVTSSLRLVCSTDRSTAKASAPMSNNNSSPCSNQATSSSWIISVATSRRPSGR